MFAGTAKALSKCKKKKKEKGMLVQVERKMVNR